MFMPNQQLKWIAAFVGLAVVAGYIGSKIFNSGEGVGAALDVIRKNHREVENLAPRVVKLRSVQEVGGIEAKYYTISFKNDHGADHRAVVKCTRDNEDYKCAELSAQ